MHVVRAVHPISVTVLIVATGVIGCTREPTPATSSPSSPTLSPTTVAQRDTSTRETESPGPTASPPASQTMRTTPTKPEITEGSVPAPPDAARFTPVTGDVAFVRRGSLWIADLDSGEEQMIVPNPHAEQGWHTIVGDPVWHPGGRWLAYLSYYGEDLAARQATDRAYVTFVDLEEGFVRRRLDLQASVHGGLVWDDRHPMLTFVGADADAHALSRSGDESMSGRLVYHPFEASSHLLQVTAPDGDPQSLLQEKASDEAYTGPVASVDSDRYRYVHLYRDGTIEIKELDARSGLTETVASLSFHAVNQPYSVPTLALSNHPAILVLVDGPVTGAAMEDEGLYSVAPGTDEAEHIVRLSDGCGLTAGSWQGQVALGCGAAKTTPLLVCDVEAGSCDDLALTLLDDVEGLIVPEDVPLNAVKLRPIQWSQEGDLTIVATAYAAGQPWSGDGHLLRIDVGAGTVSLVLERADTVAFAPEA